MSTFRLKIVTPEKLFWDGDVDLVVVHTIEGDIGIKANHVNYISTLDIGKIKIQTGKEKKERRTLSDRIPCNTLRSKNKKRNTNSTRRKSNLYFTVASSCLRHV